MQRSCCCSPNVRDSQSSGTTHTCFRFARNLATHTSHIWTDLTKKMGRNVASRLSSSWRRWTEAALNLCLVWFWAKYHQYWNLPQSHIKKLQNIQNSLARAVTRTPKSSHITPVLKSLHWLKINERIKYKLYNIKGSRNKPTFITVQPCYNTRSSFIVALSLVLFEGSFRYAAHC